MPALQESLQSIQSLLMVFYSGLKYSEKIVLSILKGANSLFFGL